MKIAIFTDVFEPQVNGVITHIKIVGRELRKRGHKVVIFSPGKVSETRNSPFGKVVSFKGVTYLPYPEYFFSIPNIFKIQKMCKGVDIIHSHTPGVFGIDAFLISRFNKTPLITTFHIFFDKFGKYFIPIQTPLADKLFKKISWKYIKWYYNLADCMISPTESTTRILRARKFKNIITINHGVDIERFNPNKRSESLRKTFGGDKFTFLFVGRLSYEKNIPILLKACKDLEEKYDFKLLIAGRGPQEQKLKNIVKERSIESVKFLGYIPDRKLPALYASCDCFISASAMETCGLTTLEAQASGLPVILSNRLASRDMVENGANGFLGEPIKADFKKLMRRAMSMDLRQMKRNSRQFIVENHSLKKSVDELLGCYLSVIKQYKNVS